MTNIIKNIVNTSSSNLAFLIGNGIHYQYSSGKITWKNLLETLWREYYGNDSGIPLGISFTEFYDLIELTLYQPKRVDRIDLKKIANQLKESNFGEIIDINKISSYIYDKASVIDKQQYLDALREVHRDFVKTCREWCNENMEGSSTLTDDECIRLMNEVVFNDAKLRIFRNSIKRNVAKKLSHQDTNLKECINFIKKLRAPILTTNFDTCMSESIGAKRYMFSSTCNSYSNYVFTDFYPWNVYYSDHKLDNPLTGFAIWHINGTIDYPRSIRLGLSDYMGCVERARKMLQGNSLNEYFSGKNKECWVGFNTWLHIFFNKNLFIFGLTLDENEVFLRWLLIQREKYSLMYGKHLKGWYINHNISSGKKCFLEHLGFEVIDIPNYSDLYEIFKN